MGGIAFRSVEFTVKLFESADNSIESVRRLNLSPESSLLCYMICEHVNNRSYSYQWRVGPTTYPLNSWI